MTEYTREITPINPNAAPRVQAPTNSLGADIANAVGTGLQAYAMFENRARENQANELVESLTGMEVELTNQGLSRTEVLTRLDKKIKEMSPDASSASFLRQSLAQRRGGFVRNQIVKEEQNEELQRQQMIEGEFQTALSNAPEFYGIVKRNADGTVDEQEKLRIIDRFGQRQLDLAEAQRLDQISKEQIAQGGEDVINGVVNLATGLQKRIDTSLRPLADQYISTVNGMTVSSPENQQMLMEANSEFQNTLNIFTQQVESEYNSALSGLSDEKASELLRQRRDDALAQINRIKENLSTDDLNQAKKNAQMLEMMETNLKITGLENFGYTSLLQEIAPQSATLVVQSLYAKRPEMFSRAEQELIVGLNGKTDAQIAGDAIKNFASFYQNNDTTKVDDDTLEAFYDYSKKVISGPALTRDLSDMEVDKVSGGLVGILAEAAATDDPTQIQEASKLLNSDNFKVFMDQLPEERRAQMGRYINGFNQEVLIDRTDGLLKQLDMQSESFDIEYDATQGKFVLGDVVKETLPAGSLGFNVTRKNIAKKAVERANRYMDNIRENAQYETRVQDGDVLVDSMLSLHLPESIKVRGKLNVPEAQEGTEQPAVDEETMKSNEQIIRELREEVLSLNQRLVGSGV